MISCQNVGPECGLPAGWQVLPRIDYGGALSGRDTTAVDKTLNGLLKLMQPNPDVPVSDELLEWAVKIALEYRRRVKEQQKRVGSAEFRNTHFSYRIGDDGVETLVTTPEYPQRKYNQRGSTSSRTDLGNQRRRSGRVHRSL